MLPKAVGSKPSVPRTSGCTVSPRYTGNDKDATPTQKPDNARPASTIHTKRIIYSNYRYSKLALKIRYKI